MLSVIAQLPRPGDIQTLGEMAVYLFIAAIVLCFLILIFLLWVGWWVTQRQGSVSVYTGKPMQRGEDLGRYAIDAINSFVLRHDPIDNPRIDLNYAAICRETGRVFPDCVNRLGIIVLDWSFLARRYGGSWVSWGSLTIVQQSEVRSCHDSLEGFQTEVSSPNSAPKNIDMYHAMTKPGPLYVDPSTKILMGWKCVPGTTLEVLIVQRPYYTRESS